MTKTKNVPRLQPDQILQVLKVGKKKKKEKSVGTYRKAVLIPYQETL